MPVTAGQTFSFYVSSVDNIFGGLNVTISNFSFSSTPLLLTLLSFTGSNSGSGRKLQWSTGTEQALNQFEVHRSDDGKEFTKVGSVQAANSSLGSTYSYLDQAGAGTFFYRLKMIDIGSSFEYSPVVRISGESAPASKSIQCFPSPFTTTVNVDFQSRIAQQVTVNLVDFQGRMISSQSVKVSKGSEKITLDNLNTLPTGMYLVSITNGKRLIAQQKIIKL